MTKIMIVDDEPGQVNAFQNIIKKMRPDFEIFSTICGKEALAYAESNDIDVVITDIKMPQINGFEIMDQIANQQKDVLFVILSGYSEFHYAQRAIQFGVFEYLVKPVSKASLERLFNKIDERFNKKRLEIGREVTLQKKWESSVRVYKEHQLSKWVADDISEKELTEIADYFPFKEYGIVILTKIGRYEQLVRIHQRDGMKEWLQRIRTILQEKLHPTGHSVSFFLEGRNDRIVTILTSAENLRLEKGNIEQKLNEIIENTKNETGIHLSVGVSSASTNIIHDIRLYFEQADQAREHSFFSDRDQCILYSNIGVNKEENHLNIYELESKLTNEIKKGSISGICRMTDETFRNLYKDRLWIKPGQLKEYLVYVVLNIVKIIHIALEPEHYYGLIESLRAEIYDCEKYEELRRTIKKIMVRFADSYKNMNYGENYTVIQKCKQFIDDHYMEEISLDSMSSMFYLNPSYLSNLFKTYVGMGYSDYLTNVRMQKAQYFLKTSHEKIYHIALQVGYSDATYFIKVFKKKVGISPDKYRRLLARYEGEEQ